MSSPKAKLGNRRVTGKEQFYTPLHIAHWVVERVITELPQTKNQTWLEPSAGSGSFLKALSTFGISDVIAIDIEPAHPQVMSQDFFNWQSDRSDLVAIGNPPFGRNNSLSIPFFNKCAQVSETIAFIVPRSWRKWSVTNRLSLDFHCIVDEDLAVNYVDVSGADVYAKNNLRTCLQIWQKSEVRREVVSIPDYGFVQKVSPDQADIALKVFGYGCGTVLTDFDRVPNTTLMFLKVNDRRAVKALRDAPLNRYFNNVAYTEALAFTEVNAALNQMLIKS
ncbi:MAG: hypothetical protein KGQ38_07645 [Actinomycetales bacterium]|nr:hypothetical protein [Actinomycetales bacterium]